MMSSLSDDEVQDTESVEDLKAMIKKLKISQTQALHKKFAKTHSARDTIEPTASTSASAAGKVAVLANYAQSDSVGRVPPFQSHQHEEW
jgi:hypothetical protein